MILFTYYWIWFYIRLLFTAVTLPQIYWLIEYKCNLFILQFWRSAVQNGSQWAKIQALVGLYSLLETLVETGFPCLFQFLVAAPISWLWSPPPIFQASSSSIQPFPYHITLTHFHCHISVFSSASLFHF